MAISFQILGRPFQDNALFVRVEPGEYIHRILLDCGERILDTLRNGEIMAIDHLCFSHYHMDHVAGFDSFFRLNYNREDKPLFVWGPEETPEILHHRLRGFTWDLVAGKKGYLDITEVTREWITTTRAYTGEAFNQFHRINSRQFQGTLFAENDLILEATILRHHIPVLAYKLSEPDSVNIDKEALDGLELEPGPWLETVKDTGRDSSQVLHLGDRRFRLGELQEKLLQHTPGESIAYATDFIWEKDSVEQFVEMITGADTLVCEATYLEGDRNLAEKHYHITARQAGKIAARANVGQLVLVHFSQRYLEKGVEVLVKEAREVFSETTVPESWITEEPQNIQQRMSNDEG